LRDPDFTLFAICHYVAYGKQNIQKQKNKKKFLYVCFEVNHKNIFNLRFCEVIVNAQKNNQCFVEMARKKC